MIDHALALAAQRRTLATELRAMSQPARRQHVLEIVTQTGGTMIPQQPNSNWGQVFAEFSVLGLYASGDTLDETIINWIKIASRAAPLPPATQESRAA